MNQMVLTNDLLTVNEQDPVQHITIDIVLCIDHTNNTHRLEMAYRRDPRNWTFFRDIDPEDFGALDGWEPEAVREALDKKSLMPYLSDEIKDSGDWAYYYSWADAAEDAINSQKDKVTINKLDGGIEIRTTGRH